MNTTPPLFHVLENVRLQVCSPDPVSYVVIIDTQAVKKSTTLPLKPIPGKLLQCFSSSQKHLTFVTLVLLHMMHDFGQSQKILSLLYPDL